MKQSPVQLKEYERSWLQGVRRRGVSSARQVNRAHLLLSLDAGIEESIIMKVLGISRGCLGHTRARYLEGGLGFAMNEKPRPGAPEKYDAAVHAELAALACSDPPKGRKRWTVRRLVESLREKKESGSISRESVRLFLKKTP
jgi:transposase